jgi:hypothetical protein
MFRVIDKQTGQAPDLEEIALHEAWADGLIYCDIEGFAMLADGALILLDECGRYRCCPAGRFEIVWAHARPHAPERSDDSVQADFGREVSRG